MQPIILIGDIDIYALGLVDKLPATTETKGLGRDKLFTDEIDIKCKNFNNEFSVDNPKSFFYKMRWRYMPVKWYDSDSILRWDGVLRDIERDHESKMAVIKTSNILAKYLNFNIEYESAAWETPADAFKNICAAIGFEYYDNKSVQESIDYYADNSCYIKCYFYKEDDVTFQQAIEKIADICAADIYGHNNKIHFKLYRKFTGKTSIIINDEDCKTAPAVTYLEAELVNNYNIKHVGCGDVATTDADNNNIGSISVLNNGRHDLSEIDGQEGNEIEIKDLASAVFIGEQAIKRSHAGIDKVNPGALQRISLKLNQAFNKIVDINSYFKLNFSDESWVEKLFEVFETEIDHDANTFKIIAVECE